MAKIVKQFRYYGPNGDNWPQGLNTSFLSNGKVFFSGVNGSIVQLGIQSVPGTKFYLNDSAEPIIIGSTGIYELDVQGLTNITALNFDQNSLVNITDTNGAYLIVDAIYETEEE